MIFWENQRETKQKRPQECLEEVYLRSTVQECVRGGMARGIHELPKLSPMLAMPNPSTRCGQATPETAVFYPLGYPMPYGPECIAGVP
jgi:hypothetical protein